MKYNSPKKSMKPNKFKQGFQMKENGLKEQEFLQFLQIYPQLRRLLLTQFQSMLLDGRNYVCVDRKHPQASYFRSSIFSR